MGSESGKKANQHFSASCEHQRTWCWSLPATDIVLAPPGRTCRFKGLRMGCCSQSHRGSHCSHTPSSFLDRSNFRVHPSSHASGSGAWLSARVHRLASLIAAGSHLAGSHCGTGHKSRRRVGARELPRAPLQAALRSSCSKFQSCCCCD